MPLLNRVISGSLLLFLQYSVRAMMLLERIPDQVVVRGSEFSLNVGSYFSETVREFTMKSPSFLSFSSRKLVPKDVARLPLHPAHEPLQSAASRGQNVFVLTKEQGLLVYRVLNNTSPQLLQHYIDDKVCKQFQHAAIANNIVALYNSSYVTVVDVTDPMFPQLLAESPFDSQIVKVFVQDNGQLLLVSKLSGVQLLDYNTEAGFMLNRTWDLGFEFHPSAAEQSNSSLFLLNPVSGLCLLPLETGIIEKLNISGTRLFLTNTSLVIDGSTVLNLTSMATWSYPAPMTTDLFTIVGDVFFFGNSTHLIAYNHILNLSLVEERAEIVDLMVFNETMLEVKTREVVLRTFVPELAVLHGQVPMETGGFEVRFVARGKMNSVEAHFMLMVEAPPLEVLMFLLGGSLCVLLLATLGCYLFRLTAERKLESSVPGMHIMSEEFSSATHLPNSRQLGPMPEIS